MKKFLIVDDSAFMRMSIKKILIVGGYTILGEADNGAAAVKKYMELRPDIITLDITMKEKTGLEALAEIIRYDANANVIMVSAMGQTPIIQEAISLGAKGFLIKPFKRELVISTVRKF